MSPRGLASSDQTISLPPNAGSPLNIHANLNDPSSPRQDGNGSDTPMGRSAGNATPGGAQQGASKKGVRQLTEAQLEKKRANDREAQRAIRERTKKQMEALEQRIQDLESGEAYRQLQATVKQKEAVEAENYELKNRLAAVLDILRPVAGSLHLQNVEDPASSFPGFSQPRPQIDPNERYLPQVQHNINIPVDPFRFNGVNGEDTTSVALGGITNVYRNALASGPPWESKQDAPISPFPQASNSSGSTPLTDPQGHPYLPDDPSTDPASVKRRRTMFGESHMRTQMGPSHRSSSTFRTQAYTQLPSNIAPTCRLDTIIYDFATESRRRLATGLSLTDVVGPAYPVFNSMVDPQHPSMHSHPLSELLIEVLKGFSAISGLPEKIAVISEMFVFMRWYISPTPETFEALPPFLIPVDEQLRVRHPIWVDLLPWPAMRAKMVYHYPQLPLDNFFIPYSTTLALEFPLVVDHPSSAALADPNIAPARDPRDGTVGRDFASCLYRDAGSDELRAHPELDKAWRRLETRSLGAFLVESLPMLEGTCRIREEGGVVERRA